MIKDLIVKDNFFENTQEILALAKAQKYDAPKSHDNWAGMRSPLLNDVLSAEDMERLYTPISEHMFHSTLRGVGEYSFQYKTEMYFHYLDKNIKYTPKFFHRDTSLMAGVVYLSETPTNDSGTILINNGEECKVDNVFNRCVLYNSSLLHAPLNGFGKTVDDARLTLTIFFGEISISKRKSERLV
jgi:hypothetical protein